MALGTRKRILILVPATIGAERDERVGVQCHVGVGPVERKEPGSDESCHVRACRDT